MNSYIRDLERGYVLHVIVFEEVAGLKGSLSFCKCKVFRFLTDYSSRAPEGSAGSGQIDRDALASRLVEDITEERHIC